MRHIIFVTAILSVAMVSFCTFADVIGKTDEDVRTIAEPILNNILEGMKTDDYEGYSRDFNETMKRALPKRKFLVTNRQIKKLFGDYKSRQYHRFLNQKGMTIVLWKGSFDKADVLIRLVVVKQRDEYFVTGLWFQ